MDYSKLKVTELKELLQARSLPVSGKKEELVARLTESDAAKPIATDDLGDLAPPEEEYDWDAPATKTYRSPSFKANHQAGEIRHQASSCTRNFPRHSCNCCHSGVRESSSKTGRGGS